MRNHTKQFLRLALMLTIAVGAFGMKAKAASTLSLTYDDRHTFSSAVTSVETLRITSNQVGSSRADKDVVMQDSTNAKRIIAVGCGRARVLLKNGTKVQIDVSPAPISLLLIAGQSNAEGVPSDRVNLVTYQSQSVRCAQGQVYSTYAPATFTHYQTIGCFDAVGEGLSIDNAANFVPYSLTDNSGAEWQRTNNLTDAPGACGKLGFDSALAYEWNKKTGEKVWVVNAAHSSTSIKSWLPGDGVTDNEFWQAVRLYQAAEKTLNREIAAGHYILSHKGYFWLQGEANLAMSTQGYIKYFKQMHQGFESQLEGRGLDYVYQSLEFGGILMVRAHQTGTEDLTMTGARIAQFYLGQTGIIDNVYLASDAEELWVTDAGVKRYFSQKYGTQSKYNKANPLRGGTATMPSKSSHVKNQLHYKQLGYNEIGMDAADNICYARGYAKAPSTTATIEVVSLDGYKDMSASSFEQREGTVLLAVPKVYPAWLARDLRVSQSSAFASSYYRISYPASGSVGRLTYSVGNVKKRYALSCYPNTPKLQSATGWSTGITLRWKGQKDAAKYRIYRKISGGSWRSLATVSGKTTKYSDRGARLGTTYAYTVRALNAADTLSGYDKTGLACRLAVSLQGAQSVKGGICVRWNRISGAAGYYIYRKDGNRWKKIATVGEKKSSYTDKKVEKGTKYTYMVRAFTKSKSLSGYRDAGVSATYTGS